MHECNIIMLLLPIFKDMCLVPPCPDTRASWSTPTTSPRSPAAWTSSTLWPTTSRDSGTRRPVITPSFSRTALARLWLVLNSLFLFEASLLVTSFPPTTFLPSLCLFLFAAQCLQYHKIKINLHNLECNFLR